MSLWACIEHGLAGPMACCGKASLASLTATNQFHQKAVGGSDVCHTCAAHCVVIEDHLARIASIEATAEVRLDALTKAQGKVRDLEAALDLLVKDIQGYEAWERPCYALDAAIEVLSTTSETPGEPEKPKFQYDATCCKCGKVVTIDRIPQGVFFCSYGCT